MRQLMIFAVVLVVLGGVAARYADQAVSSPPQQAAVVQPAYEPREPTTSGRSLMLEADRLGHFQAEARIDGRSVGFIVDTGASLVVLRESDAARVGDPSAAERLHGDCDNGQWEDQGGACHDRPYRARRYYRL
jgi:aspartyl protease family protein